MQKYETLKNEIQEELANILKMKGYCEIEAKIISFLKMNKGKKTQQQISEKISYSQGAVSMALKNLHKINYINKLREKGKIKYYLNLDLFEIFYYPTDRYLNDRGKYFLKKLNEMQKIEKKEKLKDKYGLELKQKFTKLIGLKLIFEKIIFNIEKIDKGKINKISEIIEK